MALTHVVLPWKCTNIENSNTLDQAHDILYIFEAQNISLFGSEGP